jgi:hypothetical protein
MGSSRVSCGVGLFVLFVSAGSVQAQTSPWTPQSPPAQPAAVPTSRVFGSDAGRVPNFIKPDNATDFEAVVARLREALQKIDKPARGQQPTGWKV